MPNQQESEQYFGGILAPTFSQAFRWFREKYGLFYDILKYVNIGWNFTIYGKTEEVFNQYNATDMHTPKYDSYEEAELACLRKLIEIVKNKN